MAKGFKSGGRKKGTPDKIDALIKDAVAKKIATAREPEIDSKDRMRQMAMVIDKLVGDEFKKATRNVKLIADLAFKAVSAWDKVAKFEHPVLASVQVTRPPMDLGKLSDEEFNALHAIVAKHSTDRDVGEGEGQTQH